MYKTILMALFCSSLVFAQEQPIPQNYPHPADCFAGCSPSNRSVTYRAFVKFPTAPYQTNGCATYCRHEGEPPWYPPPGTWRGCSSSAPAGIGCNAAGYTYPITRYPYFNVICDAGQIDGTINWDGAEYPPYIDDDDPCE